ncbi:hypothetical protein [Hydrogenimonas urashimensis]|uniref:hypothetical protein n=1 Tax=Hydrogenimonas urashimensis TaxID=2740515 RepID=UPI0019169587|nr:hypothetical protein [Hydrogenimonas urashimensis]
MGWLMKRAGLAIVAAVWVGCTQKPVVKLYKAAHERPITCLRLSIYPPQKDLEATLRSLYPFSKRCDVVLEVKHKENICCNSNQNAQRKALTAFPHHFLRLEVRRGLTPLYSYYIDLSHPADEKDASDAFERLRSDLKF